MTASRCILVSLALLTGTGCSLFNGLAQSSSSKARTAADAEATDAATDAATDSDSGDEAAGADGASEEETVDLEAQMAPPEGTFDLRPIFGTDANEVLPPVFRNVKKGMSFAEVRELFPGVRPFKDRTGIYASSNGGKVWAEVGYGSPHETITFVTDEDGNLSFISYNVAQKDATEDLWPYAQKAARLKWGEPEKEDKSRSLFKPEGVRHVSLTYPGGGRFALEVAL